MIKFSRSIAIIAVVLPVLAMHFGFAAAAQSNATSDLQYWDNRLSAIEKRLESGGINDLETRNLRLELEQIGDSAAAIRDGFAERFRQIKDLLSALRPKAKKKGAPESNEVKSKRIELERELAAFQGQAKQSELIITKSNQIISGLARKSRERLKATLFKRGVSPLTFGAWKIAGSEILKLTGTSIPENFKFYWQRINRDSERRNSLALALIVALALAALAFPLGRKIQSKFGRVPGIAKPSYSRRLLAGVAEGVGRVLVPVVLVLALAFMFVDDELVSETAATFVGAIVRSLIVLFIGYALINAAFTPQRPQWRLIDFGADATRLLVNRLRLVLIAFVILDGAGRSLLWAVPSGESLSVASLVFVLVLTPLLFSLLDRRIWERGVTSKDAEAPKSSPLLVRIRTLLAFVLLALPILAILGYAKLSTYLLNALVISGLMIGTLAMLRAIGRESLLALFDARRFVGNRIRKSLDLDDRTSGSVVFWLRLLLDIALIVLVGIVLLPVWGVGTDETIASATAILKGVKIGSYTFSLIDIVIALALFAMFVAITRFIQRALDRHILPNLTKDRGVRDALKTGVGYLGFVIAGLIGISALGLDLSNLALIAGALSVGLGFGLQNVVSNFVSGLILLAERPIKQGDWVVIGGHEGRVKNVNVRATEIETFQRASVIIPNADLISSPVINWTHKNVLGRVDVPVGVSYNASPKEVEEVLLECAKNHPNVSRFPETYVLFMGFGQSSLDFELRAYLANVEERMKTGSDLRYAIFDALKEHDIEIPFPQRVLHMASSNEPASE